MRERIKQLILELCETILEEEINNETLDDDQIEGILERTLEYMDGKIIFSQDGDLWEFLSKTVH